MVVERLKKDPTSVSFAVSTALAGSNHLAAVVALKAGFGCDAINVGINLGQAAGGSQSDHLHVHCVPRWAGDANFMTVAAETRVLPVPLDEAFDRLRAAWPGQ